MCTCISEYMRACIGVGTGGGKGACPPSDFIREGQMWN